MEKQEQEPPLESGVLILIVAAILVARERPLGARRLQAARTHQDREVHALEGERQPAPVAEAELQVDAYVTKGLPKLDAFVRDLRDLLQEYKNAGGGKFDYTHHRAEGRGHEEEGQGRRPRRAAFGEASDTEDEKAAVTQGFMGLVFKYGEQKDVIKFLPPDRTDGLEFWITNKIREIRDKGDDIHHKIGVLTGHDEIKLTDDEPRAQRQHGQGPSMQGIITQNFPFYTFAGRRPEGRRQPRSPTTLDGLIITQPGKDLTEKELRRIDQFVMKGKSLAVFASAVNIKANDATMNATLNLHGLDKLLDGYGIDDEQGRRARLRPQRSRVVVPTAGGHRARSTFPQILDVQDDPRFTGNEQLLDTRFPALLPRARTSSFPFASSLALKPDKQPDAKMKVVARSSPRGPPRDGRHGGPQAVPEVAAEAQGPEQQQFAIAADVEGTLKTAFPAGDKIGRRGAGEERQARARLRPRRRRSSSPTRSPAPATARTWASTA